MRDLIYDVINYCLQALLWENVSVCYQIVIKNPKKVEMDRPIKKFPDQSILGEGREKRIKERQGGNGRENDRRKSKRPTSTVSFGCIYIPFQLSHCAALSRLGVATLRMKIAQQ